MEQSSPPGAVLDAGDHDFDDVVIERSRTVPVLVDFWAPWCGPCRVLGPVLEKVGKDLAGKVEIVKVNTDDNRGVAARYRISSIPAVKLFEDGEVRAEFVGAQPEPRVRAFLDEHLPTGAIRQARAGAEEALYAGEYERAIELAKQVPASSPDWEKMQAIMELAEDLREPPASDDALGDAYVAALSKLLDRDPTGALDGLLSIVAKDKKWGDEAARRAMLAIFQLLGVRSEVSDAYRKKLALLL
jgi:putative thioredoxin